MGSSDTERQSLFRRALVVDDEGGLQLLVRAILEHGAYLVDIAKDGVQACEVVQNAQYDVIICDIRMPNMSGTDFYLRLREVDARQAERVVFVTGADLSGETKTQLRESGRPILHKPFEIDEFTELVDQIAAAED